MRHRRKTHHNLGEAISLEAVLTLMTLIFILRMLFLVPLISIDKARLEKTKVDHFWGDVVAWLGSVSSADAKDAEAYSEAFELHDPLFILSSVRDENASSVRYIESLTQDSSLVVVRHELQTNIFSQMVMSKNGETTTYRHGKLSRISGSTSWFPAQEEDPDYGDDVRSKSLNKLYRDWRSLSMKGLQ